MRYSKYRKKFIENCCLLSRHFNVIVKRWTTNENTEELRRIPANQLNNYESSNHGAEAYVAITQEGYHNGAKIRVGDDKDYSLSQTVRRKRRNTPSYRNGPLSENTQYAIFIRVFYDEVSIF